MENFTDDDDDFSFSNIKSIINYIITNYHKFILLLLVGVIIYFVDYITHINAFIYGSQQVVPGLTSLATPTPPNKIKIPKQKGLSKKNRRN
jgi:hypothetical protein